MTPGSEDCDGQNGETCPEAVEWTSKEQGVL